METNPTDHEQQAFERKIFKGGRSLVASQIGRFALRVASTLCVTRLLTPVDYGIFGMALVVYGLLYTIKDLGLLSAAVSSPTLDGGQQRHLLRVTIVSGVMVGLLFCVLGPVAAQWNHEPRLVPIFVELALCFAVNGIGTYPQTMLSRQLRYGALSAIEIVSMAVSVLTAVGFALHGDGYWALVHMTLSAEIARTVGSWWVLGPTLPATGSPSSTRPVILLGLSIAGFGAINYTAQSCDQFLIGVWFGTKALGLYGRATQFTFIPAHFLLGPISGWMTAALSRLRGDPQRYRALNRQVSNAVAHLIFPLAAFFIAAPTPAISLLLGARWIEAGPILQALALGLMAQPLLFAQNWLLISQGKGRRLCVLAVINLAILLALCAGLRPWGVNGVAVAVSLTAILALPGTAWAVRTTPVRLFHDVLAPLWRPFVLFLILTVAAATLIRVVPTSTLGTLVAFTLAGAIWIAAGCIWKSARAEWRTGLRAFGAGAGSL